MGFNLHHLGSFSRSSRYELLLSLSDRGENQERARLACSGDLSPASSLVRPCTTAAPQLAKSSPQGPVAGPAPALCAPAGPFPRKSPLLLESSSAQGAPDSNTSGVSAVDRWPAALRIIVTHHLTLLEGLYFPGWSPVGEGEVSLFLPGPVHTPGLRARAQPPPCLCRSVWLSPAPSEGHVGRVKCGKLRGSGEGCGSLWRPPPLPGKGESI